MSFLSLAQLMGIATASQKKLVGARGAGICMAQQKRAAKKARNVKRHRAHVRG